MIRVTMKRINAVLKAAGHDVELVKGDGYFWFCATGSKDAPINAYDEIESIYTNFVGDLTPGQILTHVEEAVAAFKPHEPVKKFTIAS